MILDMLYEQLVSDYRILYDLIDNGSVEDFLIWLDYSKGDRLKEVYDEKIIPILLKEEKYEFISLIKNHETYL